MYCFYMSHIFRFFYQKGSGATLILQIWLSIIWWIIFKILNLLPEKSFKLFPKKRFQFWFRWIIGQNPYTRELHFEQV